MSEQLHYFSIPGRRSAVALPMCLDRVIADWAALRTTMIRHHPPEFSRDEWAYLISFLSPERLTEPFEISFGSRVEPGPVDALLRPRGLVGVWLPNNVSLLGPLTLILLSLTGNPLRLKAGTKAQNLTKAFLEYARQNLPSGELSAHLEQNVVLDQFDRLDSRNRELAASAAVRIVFGSESAVQGIDRLDHPPTSTGIAFAHRRSQAWIARDCLSDSHLTTLLKVFAVYGQAGCTSPACAVLLDLTLDESLVVRDRLVTLWKTLRPDRPAMHLASENLMNFQRASALGQSPSLVDENAAVLTVDHEPAEEPAGLMTLQLMPASVDEAFARLPKTIQTIGHALTDGSSESWLTRLAATSVSRFVPLERMHHFGPVWDSMAWWRQMFDEVEIAG